VRDDDRRRRQARVLPDRDDLEERLDSVLDAIYAVFAEGWSDPAGIESLASSHWHRKSLVAKGTSVR